MKTLTAIASSLALCGLVYLWQRGSEAKRAALAARAKYFSRKSQPWHTDGYLILSSALLYIAGLDNQGIVCEDDAVSATSILVEAGRAIRKEYNS